MCKQDSKAAISEQTVYQTVYTKKTNVIFHSHSNHKNVQLINLMSKVPNRFRYHNTLRESIPLIDYVFGECVTLSVT